MNRILLLMTSGPSSGEGKKKKSKDTPFSSSGLQCKVGVSNFNKKKSVLPVDKAINTQVQKRGSHGELVQERRIQCTNTPKSRAMRVQVAKHSQ